MFQKLEATQTLIIMKLTFATLHKHSHTYTRFRRTVLLKIIINKNTMIEKILLIKWLLPLRMHYGRELKHEMRLISLIRYQLDALFSV